LNRFAQFVVSLAALVLLALSEASAQTVVTVGSQPLGVVSIGTADFLSCANNGQGEWVYVFGPEQFRWTFVTYSNGSIRGTMWGQGDFQAIGYTTGLTYNSKDTWHWTFLTAPGQMTGSGSHLENYLITGNGVGFHYHETIRYTWVVDPVAGIPNMTIYHGNIFLACK
jgi:hypothetical protein